MNLRLWIPCILLIVIFIIVLKAYFVEGFQSGGSGSGSSTRLSENDTRIRFWSIVNEDKAGSSGSSTKELLSQVINPGPTDTFKLVFPKYISMYALATYNNNPVAARKALLNDFDAMQNELKTKVDQEIDKRTAFAANPKAESCALLNKLTLSLYGKLLAINTSAQDISGNAHLAEDLHKENIDIQSKSACMNQGASPSAACIALARLDEKLFPLLPVYTNANISLISNAQQIQSTIDLLLQAYMGIECLPVGGSASGSGPLSISSVFSSEYLTNLPIIDTESFKKAMQELSPYYVSTNIVNFISGQLVGTPEFNSELATTDEFIKNMAKTTNSIVSLTSLMQPGQFFSEAGSGPGVLSIQNCPPGYYCPATAKMPIQCPVGFYCPAGTTETPIECPPDRPFTPMGASKPGDCDGKAPLGYYIDPVLSKVVQCPAGYYCPGSPANVNGGSNPGAILCPAGTYNMKKGMGNILSCTDCPKGSYCPTTTQVVPCKIGTYNPTTRQTTISGCLPCPPGHYCPQKGVVQPTPCAPGTFSNIRSTGSTGSTGSGISITIGAGASCTPVSPGYFLPGDGNLTDALKMPCHAGYYCPGGTAIPIMCPAGTYCPNLGSGSGSGSRSGSGSAPGLTAPIKCPAGTYGSSDGATTSACSGQCAAGYVCPAGSTTATVIDCPSGFFCPAGSGTGTPCPAGSYCPLGSTDKRLCPPNTYNPLAEQTSILACQPCPAAKKCVEGTVNPAICPGGYYCPSGVDPVICPMGSYCPRGVAFYEPCPAGMTCTSLGTGGSGKSICGIGYHLLNGACEPCPPGQLCDSVGEEGSSIAGCPPGTYSTGGAGSGCTPCPPGRYGTGSSTTSNCSGLCTAGYYCPAGSTTATAMVCPAGYYCPAGTGTVCPTGKSFSTSQQKCV